MSLVNHANPQAEPVLSSSLWPVSSDGADVLDLRTVVQRHICFVLTLNKGNKLKTARQLGISRSTLYRMLDGELPSQP